MGLSVAVEPHIVKVAESRRVRLEAVLPERDGKPRLLGCLGGVGPRGQCMLSGEVFLTSDLMHATAFALTDGDERRIKYQLCFAEGQKDLRVCDG
jgi:hypothetical protein